MIVIEWLLDLQLPMQPVSLTTYVRIPFKPGVFATTLCDKGRQ